MDRAFKESLNINTQRLNVYLPGLSEELLIVSSRSSQRRWSPEPRKMEVDAYNRSPVQKQETVPAQMAGIERPIHLLLHTFHNSGFTPVHTLYSELPRALGDKASLKDQVTDIG